MHFLTTIGIVLATIGILLIIILKRPLKLSDRLLIAILSCFVLKFALDEVHVITGNPFYSSVAAVVGLSTIATCGWYIKYLTDTNEDFGAKQLPIYIPALILVPATFPLLRVPADAYGQSAYFRVVVYVMTAVVFYYFYFCIRMLQKHKQLILQNYSGVTGNITINWMVIIISLQIAEFLLKGVLSALNVAIGLQTPIITNEYCFIIETFLLVILGIWQKSIPVFVAPPQENAHIALEPDDLRRYRLKIENYMTEHRPYLDPELTIEKLSDLTRIKKLTLSQTLNKSFNKNFFTFIKEYRIAHVEEELKNGARSERTIMDIAYSSGFNSKTGFNRAFKEVTGKTPTEYLAS